MANTSLLNRQQTIDVSVFRQRLLMARLKFDMTQEQFARKVGTSLTLISRWENGTSLPDLRSLVKLCKALNCSADFLLGLQYEFKTTRRKEGE